MALTPDPFTLFALYYLGVSPEGTYRFTNANQVARHLNWTPDMVLDYLKKHHMDPDRVLNLAFPLSQHQVDIQLAASEEPPERILERARLVYQSFQSALTGGQKRDWIKEIRDEQRADQERGK